MKRLQRSSDSEQYHSGIRIVKFAFFHWASGTFHMIPLHAFIEIRVIQGAIVHDLYTVHSV